MLKNKIKKRNAFLISSSVKLTIKNSSLLVTLLRLVVAYDIVFAHCFL
jgi:hypothetical protein